MQVLGFTAPISNNGLKKFSSVVAFDDYFCLSGRKYQVIEQCSSNGRQGYRVERHDTKVNIPLNILKVVSYMTGLVPLIMCVGKLIARSRHQFFINSNQDQTVSLKPIKRAATEQIVLPPLDKDLQDRAQIIQKFKDQALTTFHQASILLPSLDFSLTKEQEDSLIHTNNHKYHPSVQGAKVIMGGGNLVFFLDNVPGFVFKPQDDFESAKRYVEVANRARQTAIDHNLYLLHVPEAQVININDNYFVMQEKASLLAGNYQGQEGVYQCCWSDEEMDGYIKTLFDQLIQFICISHFRDVKYDNIPLTTDGRVALIDLDENNAIGGLTKGGAGKNDGLFNYIPLKHIDYFLEVAKPHLSQDEFHELELKVADIKVRAEKKEEKKESYLEFAKQNAISSPSQLINSNFPMLYENKKKQKLAKFIVESINKNLSQSENFSLQVGRTTAVKINTCDEIFEKAKQIWGRNFHYLSFQPDEVCFMSILPDVLNGLKKAGYIHKYKIVQLYNYVKITC